MRQDQLHLVTLKLQNFATFRQREISFGKGLNAIVGETGSGKSLILDALQLVFGGRADKKSVRLGAESALVEAVLAGGDADARRALDEMGFPSDDGEIVIKRVIKRDGTGKCWLNHMACSLQQLSQFSRRWVDLVGQFENQKLLSDAYQLRLLDQFGQTTSEAESVRAQVVEMRSLREERDALERSRSERDQRLDYLDYQIREIAQVAPRAGEEEELVGLKDEFLNHERKQLLIRQLDGLVEGDEQGGGLAGLVRAGRSLLAKNATLMPSAFQEKFQALESAYEDLRDALRGFSSSEPDQEELQRTMDRLDGYQKLKRKFGGTVEKVLEAHETFLREAERLRQVDVDLGEISRALAATESSALKAAEKLHEARIRSAAKFSSELTSAVRSLRMDGADIRLELEKGDLGDSGCTKLTFLAQTNPGEGHFKVKEIASGGELSRILLALRQVLSHHDSISIFLFDEIDAGMGGETALHIGKALRKVADHSQVIAITHLPQIAACADRLIVVSKETGKSDDGERTESLVRAVEGKAAIRKESEAMVPLH